MKNVEGAQSGRFEVKYIIKEYIIKEVEKEPEPIKVKIFRICKYCKKEYEFNGDRFYKILVLDNFNCSDCILKRITVYKESKL